MIRIYSEFSRPIYITKNPPLKVESLSEGETKKTMLWGEVRCVTYLLRNDNDDDDDVYNTDKYKLSHF